MNVLVVERDADWSQWDATSHLVGHAMLVLVQQGDETAAAFRQRIKARLARVKQRLNAFVLLRRNARSELDAETLLDELAVGRPADVRTIVGGLIDRRSSRRRRTSPLIAPSTLIASSSPRWQRLSPVTEASS